MYKFIKLKKKKTGRKYTKNADSVYVCQKLFFFLLTDLDFLDFLWLISRNVCNVKIKGC